MPDNNFDHELGWDDSIQKDSDFIELPAGDYDFVIDHFERSRSQGSDKLPACNMAVVYFKITAPDGQDTVVKENYILHTKLEWKLSELFCGVGLKKKGEELRMNWNALPGLTGRCRVSLDTDKQDPSKKYNHIKKIYEKKDVTPGWQKGF